MNLEQLHEQWQQLDAKIDRALELDAACADLPDSLRVRDHGKLPPQDGDAERAQR